MKSDIKSLTIKTGVKSPLRAKHLMEEAIKKFRLNLTGFTILTEAASGNYIFTPLICALSGAKRVIAFTKDSIYASKEKVIESTFIFADFLGVSKKIDLSTELDPEIISKADIVTNLGFLRPINKEFISYLKPTAVIPLMFETWEFRKEDLDLKECLKKALCKYVVGP